MVGERLCSLGFLFLLRRACFRALTGLVHADEAALLIAELATSASDVQMTGMWGK